MNSEYSIKTNIALVMERIEVIKRQYEGRKLERTISGLATTGAIVFSGITAAYEEYPASLTGLAVAVLGGMVWYGLNKNTQRRKEQLDFLEYRKSELEEKLDM